MPERCRPTPLPPSPWNFDQTLWPESDCVAAGADLEPSTIIEAYRLGAFPMPHDGELLWWSPLERGVLQPANLRVSKSLTKSIRRFEVTVDTAFCEVMRACGDPSRPHGWIDGSILDAYERLHDLGWAHSVEVRLEGRLVGGLYGLSIGQLFCGESMFHVERDASKVALAALVERVGPGSLIDTQWSTPHLASLGVEEWSRERYRECIRELIDRHPIDWS